MTDSVLVGIAQITVAKAPERMSCMGLGSCVAVFVYDPVLKVGGVVHILLPRAPPNTKIEGKYADTGIRRLVREVLDKGAKKHRLKAKLVGGAQMFPNLNVKISDIGKENCHEAEKTLKNLGISVVAREIYGNRGRSATFDLSTGEVIIKTAFSNDRRI